MSDENKGVLNTLKTKRILRTWEFRVEFQNADDLTNVAKEIWISAVSFPGREVSDIELPIGGTTVKYPGPPTYNNSWTVTFRDDISLTIRKALDKYMGPVAWYEPEKATFQKNDLTVILRPEFRGEKGTAPQITLEKVFISNIGEISMNYGEESIATYDVTFNYHRWKFNE